jgi:hypothetical protein
MTNTKQLRSLPKSHNTKPVDNLSDLLPTAILDEIVSANEDKDDMIKLMYSVYKDLFVLYEQLNALNSIFRKSCEFDNDRKNST